MTELEPTAYKAARAAWESATDQIQQCPDCAGAGRHHDESNCSTCNGNGWIAPEEWDQLAIAIRAYLDALDTATITPARAVEGDQKRVKHYTVNLTEQEADALEALATEHDLPAWRVLLQGLRLYQLHVHPVDLGPKLDPSLSASPPDVSISPIGEPVAWQLWTGEEGGGFHIETVRWHAEEFARDGGKITPLFASPAVGQRETWQDIATAPKDGTHVMLAARPHWASLTWVGIGRFIADAGTDGEWWEPNNDPTDYWGGQLSGVTHWQPLPSPPSHGGK